MDLTPAKLFPFDPSTRAFDPYCQQRREEQTRLPMEPKREIRQAWGLVIDGPKMHEGRARSGARPSDL
jgi:hypothetical protein